MNRRPIVVSNETAQRLFKLKIGEKRHSQEEVITSLLDIHDRQPGAISSVINDTKKPKRGK